MLYFSEIGGTVSRATLDGNNVEQLSVGGLTTRDLAVDLLNGKLYGTYGTSGGPSVGRSDLDGTGIETVVNQTPSASWGIDVDVLNGFVYWSDRDRDAIFRARLDGSDATEVISGPNVRQPRGLKLDLAGGKIYWAESGDRSSNVVRRANLDGSGVEIIATGFRPRWVDLDVANGLIYWTDIAAGEIIRSNLDGSDRQTILSGLAGPKAIALDLQNSQMYWANAGSGEILRAGLDGSNIETLISGLDDPSGIALDLRGPIVPEPTAIVLFAFGVGGLVAFRLTKQKTST